MAKNNYLVVKLIRLKKTFCNDLIYIKKYAGKKNNSKKQSWGLLNNLGINASSLDFNYHFRTENFRMVDIEINF